MFKIAFILPILTLVGCSTPGPRLSEETYRVRIVTSSPQNCKYIGRIVGRWSGAYWTADEAIGNARVDMMNQAAEAGANTLERISSGLDGISAAFSVGEAYLCDQ